MYKNKLKAKYIWNIYYYNSQVPLHITTITIVVTLFFSVFNLFLLVNLCACEPNKSTHIFLLKSTNEFLKNITDSLAKVFFCAHRMWIFQNKTLHAFMSDYNEWRFGRRAKLDFNRLAEDEEMGEAVRCLIGLFLL